MEVRAGRLGRSREQLADALQDEVRQRLRREGDDELLAAQARQVVDHTVDAVLRVVNHDIDARHHVVLARGFFEAHGVKLGLGRRRLGAVRHQFLVSALRFADHRARDITRAHVRPLKRQRNRQRPRPAPSIAHRHALQIVVLHPRQNLINRLLMSLANVELHLIHVVRLSVNLIPPFEPGGVEIILHARRFVAASLRHHPLASFARIRQHQRRARARDRQRAADRQSRALGRLRDLARARRARAERAERRRHRGRRRHRRRLIARARHRRRLRARFRRARARGDARARAARHRLRRAHRVA